MRCYITGLPCVQHHGQVQQALQASSWPADLEACKAASEAVT